MNPLRIFRRFKRKRLEKSMNLNRKAGLIAFARGDMDMFAKFYKQYESEKRELEKLT